MKRTRIITLVAVLAVLAAALLGYDLLRRGSDAASPARGQSDSGAAESASPSAAGSDAGDSKILIVYFSRTEGVYDGPLDVGHTKVVADFIQARTGADEYEIVPATDYPTDYQSTTEIAQAEQNEDARPAIANPLPDVADYDTVFIGAPIWWGEYPMIVRTFMDGVDLNGKTLVPFTTHEGSGLGTTQSQLAAQYPDATVLDGLGVRGGEAESSRPHVDAWLEGLGF